MKYIMNTQYLIINNASARVNNLQHISDSVLCLHIPSYSSIVLQIHTFWMLSGLLLGFSPIEYCSFLVQDRRYPEENGFKQEKRKMALRSNLYQEYPSNEQKNENTAAWKAVPPAPPLDLTSEVQNARTHMLNTCWQAHHSLPIPGEACKIWVILKF